MRHFLHTAPRKGVAWSGRAVGVPPPPQRRARRPRRYAATLAAAPEPASPRQQQQEKRQQEQRQQPARPVLLTCGEEVAAYAAQHPALAAALGGRALLADTLAFTGICMARLVVGMHSYQLFAGLPDQARARVDCERAALRTARRLLAGGGGGRGVRGAVAIAAEEIAALASKPAD
ncbi:hypothetical protein Rsub_09750 [Raphidocelis subcapitata]|uniref:Uncharacterized protein n=1 Tax=Raphidocelis subcapitata TaxID=307507 RepID=A0A2V0PFD1_9CHLO|nr:hypothetical protein Rsub_09750 [Raphidocelis subcapitata]|eukprot:GBF97692.1 hypothetical protein Rsub_09750 [Raphidocelis subcapitata]